jgi:predicted DCC family thiol-disulfide oxidoreductase YuxK
MKIKQVLYDGKCGLCNKEILYYQSIAPEGKFKWVDITVPKNLACYPSINLRDALMNLHVVEGKNIKSGVDAFICIWSELVYFKLLGLIIRLPIIYQLACILYRLFANYRFKNLSHCQVVDKQK